MPVFILVQRSALATSDFVYPSTISKIDGGDLHPHALAHVVFSDDKPDGVANSILGGQLVPFSQRTPEPSERRPTDRRSVRPGRDEGLLNFVFQARRSLVTPSAGMRPASQK